MHKTQHQFEEDLSLDTLTKEKRVENIAPPQRKMTLRSQRQRQAREEVNNGDKDRRTRIDRRSGTDRRRSDRRGMGTTLDPMNIYLREMGNQKLLSHEEEIELAKMVEDGEERIQYAVLRLTLGITALNDLAENILRGSTRINTVVRGVSDNDDKALNQVRDSLLDKVEEANILDARRRELFLELKKCDGDEEKERKLVEEILAVGWDISNLFKEHRLCSKGILSVAEAVKELSLKFNKVRVVAQQRELLAARRAENSSRKGDEVNAAEIERHITLELAETIGVSWPAFMEIQQEIELGKEMAKQAKEALVRANLRLVISVAKKIP